MKSMDIMHNSDSCIHRLKMILAFFGLLNQCQYVVSLNFRGQFFLKIYCTIKTIIAYIYNPFVQEHSIKIERANLCLNSPGCLGNNTLRLWIVLK